MMFTIPVPQAKGTLDWRDCFLRTYGEHRRWRSTLKDEASVGYLVPFKAKSIMLMKSGPSAVFLADAKLQANSLACASGLFRSSSLLKALNPASQLFDGQSDDVRLQSRLDVQPVEPILVTEGTGFSNPVIGIQNAVKLVGGKLVHLQHRLFQKTDSAVRRAVPQANPRQHAMSLAADQTQHPLGVVPIGGLAQHFALAFGNRVRCEDQTFVDALGDRTGFQESPLKHGVFGRATAADPAFNLVTGSLNRKIEPRFGQ